MTNCDCQIDAINVFIRLEAVPAITALKCQGGLNLAVGTSTGQILLYDIRSSKPFFVKDHMYGLPIKCIDFHEKMDLVYSMDSSIVKIWEKNNVSKIYSLGKLIYFRHFYIYQRKQNAG
jgi:ribosome biogenesis protein ENP2